MKRIKRVISFFILIICILNMLLPNMFVLASSTTENYLIKVGTGNYAITVTANTTINEIINVLGSSKLTTKSAFGGNAYTFYTDDNYSNYLYVETLSDGRIVSYGSVDPSYQTQSLTYGIENPYIYGGGSYLHGSFCSDPKDNYIIKGGVYYNRNLVNKTSYENTILSNPTLYLKELSKQAIVMYNALSTNLGNKTNFVFDEKLYDINQEYKEKDSSIATFLSIQTNLKSKAVNLIEDKKMSDSYSVLNPMSYAYKAAYNKTTDYTGYNYAVFDYDCDKKLMRCFALDENVKNIFHNNQASDYQIVDEDVILAQNVSYALSLIDDKMTDKEKAFVLAQYLQNGNIYGKSNTNVYDYKGPLINHEAVCDGYSEAYEYLLSLAGIPADKISSMSMNHAWNVCLIDGEWTYIDTQKNVRWLSGCARSDTYVSPQFKSKTDMQNQYYYIFGDATLEDDWKADVPEGKTLDSFSYSSTVYYDDNYKYYSKNENKATNTIEGLYREDRETGERTLLAKPLISYENIDSNIVKDGEKIYFVGQDAKSIYSIKVDGTEEKIEYKTTNTNEYIGGVYTSDGYLCFATYYPSDGIKTVTTEVENKLLKLDDACSDYKIYTLDNDEQQYRLVYTKNKNGIIIIKCIGIGNNLPNGNIYIPDTIENLPVVGIAEKAFYDTFLTGDLVIPDTVEYIGKSAFMSSPNINSVKLSKNLKSIGRVAFYNCTGINQKVLEIPEGVTFIGDGAFEGCENLQSIIFPSTLDIIINGTLLNCSGLKDVLIKNENMISMEFNNITADIYLPSSTKTSDLADSKQIEYIDSKTTKPTITLSENSLEMNVGETHKLSFDLTPKFYFAYPTKFSTSNSSVATVDSNGNITAKSSGTAIISVTTSNGYKASCTVTVEEKLEFTTLPVKTVDTKDIIIFSAKNKIETVTTEKNFPVMKKQYVVEFYNESNVIKNSKDNIGSKNVIKIKDKNGNVAKEFIAVVNGDINGDGNVQMYDSFQILKGAIVPGTKLDAIDTLIRDFNNDSYVLLYDAFQFLKQAIIGK